MAGEHCMSGQSTKKYVSACERRCLYFDGASNLPCNSEAEENGFSSVKTRRKHFRIWVVVGKSGRDEMEDAMEFSCRGYECDCAGK